MGGLFGDLTKGEEMRILAAFTNSLGGKDAFALACTLAEIYKCPLDLVTVVRGSENRAITHATDIAWDEVVIQQANEWMDEAIAQSPGRVPVTKNLRYAESFPDGLLAAAEELGSSILVIGAGRHGALGKVTLGSVGNTLLHSASIPVALAPRGYRHHRQDRITRVTAMLGQRISVYRHFLDNAEELAAAADCPLRLVSLLTDPEHKTNPESRENEVAVLQQIAADRSQNNSAEISVAAQVGDNTEDAVAALTWKKNEVALLGSSRLAQKGRLFLGSTANKIIRATPVPLIVIPTSKIGEEGS